MGQVKPDRPYVLIQGDCRDVLKSFDDGSIDACVCDPPYELNFMGRGWDRQGIAYNVDLWRQVLRVLRPGGHLLAFGGTRTYHRMTVAIEDAGFEVRDCIQWLYGSGFPKSKSMRDIGRPELGSALKPSHEPIVLARKPLAEPTIAAQVLATGTGGLNVDACRVAGPTGNGHWTHKREIGDGNIFGGGGRTNEDFGNVNPAGGRWPPNLVLSHSPQCVRVGSKRVKASSVDGIVMASNTGSYETRGKRKIEGYEKQGYADADGMEEVAEYLCADGCPVKLLDEQAGVRPGMKRATLKRGATTGASIGGHGRYGTAKPQEVVAGYGDTGSASRFFPVFEPDPDALFLYAPKASRSEREAGLEGREPSFMATMNDGIGARPHNPDQPSAWVKNSHPTVKPLSLMRWLCRLIGVPGGVILDPFAGSGSTLVAAIQEGFECVGIEQEADYVSIARARCEWAISQRPVAVQTRLAV